MSVINCEKVKRDEFHTEKYYESYSIFGAHIVTEDEMRGYDLQYGLLMRKQ
ncbi:hypothetical protein AAHB65_19985 [Bacillus toyonensis]